MRVEDGIHTPVNQPAYAPISNALPGAFGALGGTANMATLYPFTILSPVTIQNVILRVTITGGNYDVGIYDRNGDRVVSKGSTATPAAARIVVALSAALVPAKAPYYFAWAFDGTVARFEGPVLGATAAFFRQMQFNSAFPLPTSLTLGSPSARGPAGTVDYTFEIAGGPTAG